MLADTVAELERGFTDKVDRKALRKVLFLLAERGYRPEPIEERGQVETERQEFKRAFMISADATGDCLITYGFEDRGAVRWLMANVHHLLGITRAGEERQSLDEAKLKVERLAATVASPFAFAEVPADFAFAAIAGAARATPPPGPPSLAYWRAMLREVPEVEHPAASLPRAHVGAEERRTASVTLEAAMPWRLELGLAAPLLEQLYEARTADADEETKNAQVEEATREACKEVITADVVKDHAGRLMDLAYLLHLLGEEGAGTLLAAADDLVERGHESDYARGLLDKTVVLLVQSLRASAERAKAQAR